MAQQNKDELKLKVKRLEGDLKFAVDSHKQILTEETVETYDERRVYMLKSQILQLERQVMLLSNALSSREDVLQEVENKVIKLINDHQELLSSKISGPNVPYPKSKITGNIESMQKLKGLLFRHSTLHSQKNLNLPLYHNSKYGKENITVMDVCNGRLDHLILKQISRLETDLSLLFHFCKKLKCKLETIQSCSAQTSSVQFDITFPTVYKDLIIFLNEGVKQISNTANELLSLSLLYPNSPWLGVLNSQNFSILKTNWILKTLPTPISNKVKNTITAITKAHNYLLHMTELEIKALEIELEHLKESRSLQQKYSTNLIDTVTETYEQSGREVAEKISQPISNILDAWKLMKQNQNEDTLRNFLGCFKQHENELQSLSNLRKDGGINSLNDFRSNLEKNLNKLQFYYNEKLQKLKQQQSNFKSDNESVVRSLLINLYVSD